MSALHFDVVGAEPEPYAASPTLVLRLRITETTGVEVQMMSLRTQIRIEPQRRDYTDEERGLLRDLFGEDRQWGDSLRPFLWAHVDVVVNGFAHQTEVDVPVPCSYDFEVSGAKYFHSLRHGEIPLLLLFSGTVFTRGRSGLDAGLISWSSEARHRLPVSLWRDTMDAYFPNSGWIRLHVDTMDALQRFKTERALPTWEQAVQTLLDEREDRP